MRSLQWAAIVGLLWGLACLLPSAAKAGHVAGVDLSYECINACTVRVHFRAYRDCSSSISTISPIGTLSITADSGCAMPTLIGAWVNVSNLDVTPVCPGTQTRCTNPSATINGFMEHYWYADYDFCAANCSTYTIQWQTCCRNGSITTLAIPASVPMFASTTVSPFLQPCNSSPQFNNPPVLVLCQGQSYVFSQGATDPDGDSLAYSLGPCLSGPSDTVPYLSFTSPTLPLGPNWEVTVDSLTGDLFIGPDLNGPFPGSLETGVLCVYVQEWRNGVLINTIVRDLQLTIIPCPPNDPPTTFGVVNLSGGVALNQFSVSTCLGATLCFDFRVLDSDPLQTQTVWWNQSLAQFGATFALSTNSSITDTIVGQLPVIRFCWTPQATGNFNFTVVMHDDACPTYGISQYNFHIEVTDFSVQATDSVTGCKEVGLCALPPATGHLPWSYLWTGVGGLTGNPGHLDSCVVHSYPSAGNFPYQLTLEDAIGCTAVWLDTVVIPNNVLADAGVDMVQCANQPIVIGNPPQISQFLTYSWSPLVGLTNANSAQPTVTLPNNTTVAQTHLYILSITDTITYCVDDDTMLVTVFPIPSSPFNMPDTVCQYENVVVLYTGGSGPTASYDWTFAGGNPSSATGQGPQQVSWTTPGRHEVTLVVTENGCQSPTERDTIVVRQNPTAVIPPVADQCLVGNSFNFQNLGVFGPNATHHWMFWPNAVPSSSGAQNPFGVVFATAGPKLVTLTTTDGQCSSIPDSITFVVHADPNVLWSVVGGVQCFNGNSHQFVAQAGNGALASYAWTFQDGSPASSTDTLPLVHFTSPGPKIVTLTVTANGCTSSSTDTIMVYPEPTVVAGPDTSFCQGSGGVGISAWVTGGTAPFYYTWGCPGLSGFCGIDSLNDDDPNVNPSQSAIYYVHVTDANGCESNMDSLWVTMNVLPSVNAGPDVMLCGLNAPCEVLTPTVSGIGPFSFEWLPATGLNDSSLFNPCARPLSTTIYALLATDLATGCTSAYNTLDTLSTVTVTVNQVPIADAGPNQDLCPTASATLQGTGSAAGPSYQFQWTPSSFLSAPNVASPQAFPPMSTTYSLVVWSNGCPSVADTVRVEVHTMPSVDAGWDREICLGESTLLDASAAGDSTAQYTFHWSNAIGLDDPYLEDPIATPPTSMTYFVIATSNWGCSSVADSVTVLIRPTPIANAGADTTICFGAGLHLQGSYYYGPTDSVQYPSQIYFGWYPSAGMSDSTLAQPLIYPQVSAMYYLGVRYNVCHTLDSVLVTVIPPLDADILADTAVICGGDSLPLQAVGGFGNSSYEWSPPALFDHPFGQHPIAYLDDTTTISLILSESGCHDTLTMEIDVIPTSEPGIVHSLLSGCAPLEVSLLSMSADAQGYVWDFGDGSPVSNIQAPHHTYTQAGTFELNFTALHEGGCNGEAAPLEVTVYSPATPLVQAVPDSPVLLYLPAANVVLNELNPNIAQSTWDFGDGVQAIGSSVVHSYLSPGTYFIVVHAANAEGCMVTDSLGPFVVRLPDLFIPNVFSPNGDGTNDFFLVDYSGSQTFDLKVMDRWGGLVYQSHNKLRGWDGLLRGEPVPDGTYYYYVRIGGKDYAGELSLLR